MDDDESFLSKYWGGFVGAGVGILLLVVILSIGNANNKARRERLAAQREHEAAEAQRQAELDAGRKEERRRNPHPPQSTQRSTATAGSSRYYISPERADRYLGIAAQQEMKDFLRQNGSSNPSQQDIDFALRFNERLEYHTEKATKNPELYR